MTKSLTPALRRARIASHVALRGQCLTHELAQRFGVSGETIRRDIAHLAEAGRLRRMHGGARALPAPFEGRFASRLRRHIAEKRRIAEKLAAAIGEGQTLFMDTGSTTLIGAEALASRSDLVVITNSIRIAEGLGQGAGQADLHLLGGRYRADNAQTIGEGAVRELSRFQADIAVLTVGSLTRSGAADFSAEEAEVARAMIGAARAVWILADHSKFEKHAPFRLCPLEKIDLLITGQPPKPALARALEKAGVKIL